MSTFVYTYPNILLSLPVISVVIIAPFMNVFNVLHVKSISTGATNETTGETISIVAFCCCFGPFYGSCVSVVW